MIQVYIQVMGYGGGYSIFGIMVHISVTTQRRDISLYSIVYYRKQKCAYSLILKMSSKITYYNNILTNKEVLILTLITHVAYTK